MIDPKEVMRLARDIRNHGATAVQNSEHGNEKAVYKYQDLADKALEELANYLGQPIWR